MATKRNMSIWDQTLVRAVSAHLREQHDDLVTAAWSPAPGVSILFTFTYVNGVGSWHLVTIHMRGTKIVSRTSDDFTDYETAKVGFIHRCV